MLGIKPMKQVVLLLLMLCLVGCGVIVTPLPPSVPTATPYTMQSLLQSLFIDDTCALPCWWGFYLGEASSEEWLTFLHDRNYDINLTFDVDVTDIAAEGRGGIRLGYDDLSFALYFTVEDSILTKLEITLYRPNAWLLPQYDRLTLPQLIDRMNGSPVIYVLDEGSGRAFPYNLWILLVYPQQGVMAEYWFRLEWDDPQPAQWQLCLGIEQNEQINLWLQNPNDAHPITDNLPSFAQQREGFRHYVPIEQIFNTNSETFAQFFLENPNTCLEVAYLAF